MLEKKAKSKNNCVVCY